MIERKGGKEFVCRHTYVNSCPRAENACNVLYLNMAAGEIEILFEQGCPPATRGFSPVRFEPSGSAPSFGRLDRGQKRSFSLVPAHRLQEHEEVLGEVQAEQRRATESTHHARSRGNGTSSCQRGPVSSQKEAGAQRPGREELRVSEGRRMNRGA